MSKAIVHIILVTILTMTALLAGCTTTSPGNIITEEKNFADFTHVDVEGAFDVEIARSDSFSIIIDADDSLFDYVTVSKVGETLRIYLTPHHIFTDFTVGAKTLEAKITMPALYGLSLSGASKGTITGFKSSEDLSLAVSGASSLDISDTTGWTGSESIMPRTPLMTLSY